MGDGRSACLVSPAIPRYGVAVPELARLLDRDELDRAAGPSGRASLVLSPAWLEEGATIEWSAPGRLVCARCEGGGCDGCARSGAIRVAVPAEARVVRFTLPARARAPLRLRLVQPFGDDAGVALLALELRAGDGVTPGCRRLERGDRTSYAARAFVLAVTLALALAAALSVALR